MEKLILPMFKGIEEWEKRWLEEGSIVSLLKARLGSLACIALAIYILMTLLIALAITVGTYFKLTSVNINYNYMWAPPLVILCPLILPLLTNWSNRNFRYSTIVIDFLEVWELVKLDITRFRFILELLLFTLYVMGNIALTLYAACAFINEKILGGYLEQNTWSLLSIIGLVHIVIYLTIRVLILPEKELVQQLVKYRREFWIWIVTLIFTFGYIVIRLFSLFTLIDFIYLAFVLLIALVRAIDIYRKIRNVIKKIKLSMEYEIKSGGHPAA